MSKSPDLMGLSLGELAALADAAENSQHAEDVTFRIRCANELVRRSQARLNDLVAEARTRGSSWQAIGDALGTSRQGAFKRFSSAIQSSRERTLMTQQPIDLQQRTRDVFENLSADNYEAVRADMTYSCARVLNKRKLVGVWNQVIAATGRFEGCADSTVQTPDGTNALTKFTNKHLINGAIVQTTLRHEAGEWIGRVAYNNVGKITGILIAPLGAKDLPF